MQAGDEDGHRDAGQQRVRQRTDLERRFLQHHEGAGITVSEADQQRGQDRALVERMLERFHQPVDHATSFPSAGKAPKVASSPAAVNTSATGPKAMALRRSKQNLIVNIAHGVHVVMGGDHQPPFFR